MRLSAQAHLPVRRIDCPGRGKGLMAPASLSDWKFHHDHHRLDHEHAHTQGGRSRSHRRDQVWVQERRDQVCVQDHRAHVFVLSVLGVLIAAAVTDNRDDGQGFGARSAWLYVTLLSIGYMISRGLAKAGSRERNDA